MEDFFGDIAEQKIRESIAKGESKNLPCLRNTSNKRLLIIVSLEIADGGILSD